jgi:hypothetical protein
MKQASPPTTHAHLNPQSSKHLRLGWWLILIFLTMGIVLEAFHAFKVFWYLDMSNATRRLMFTLAHTHGTLLGVLNLAFGLSLPHLSDGQSGRLRLAGRYLLLASLLIPVGFFLGGLVIYGGDPSLGILLVPVGAICLFSAIWLTARAAR